MYENNHPLDILHYMFAAMIYAAEKFALGDSSSVQMRFLRKKHLERCLCVTHMINNIHLVWIHLQRTDLCIKRFEKGVICYLVSGSLP